MEIDSHSTYEEFNFNDKDLKFLSIQKSKFINCTFKNAEIEETYISSCEFVNCNFKSARLNVSHIINSAFLNCKFGFADLFGSQLIDCKMVGSTFEEANLLGVIITRGDWSYTNLKFKDFKGQDLKEINFTKTDLTGSNLEKAIFDGLN